MDPFRPQFSTTLPRNFTFHYAEPELPKTPEPELREMTPEPPAAPKLRIKRNRKPLPTVWSDMSSDMPLPTIETHNLPSEPASYRLEPMQPFAEGYLAPTSGSQMLISPPKTPMKQLSANLGVNRVHNDWDWSELRAAGDSIDRPSSACSGMSDSSASSVGSMESFPSFGGSCTSPESEVADHPGFPCPQSPTAMIFSPQLPAKPLPAQPKIRKIVWTSDMDEHLLITYARLAQDPTVTPFKTLPGSAPPLGICHRVAREARRTWKTPRVSVIRDSDMPTTPSIHRFSSPDIVMATRSGSDTPKGVHAGKQGSHWPVKNSAVRKRLRYLCKRMPSLSAHYQRLMKNRTPSPFQSSSDPASGSGDFGGISKFSTRDMHISLATSTADSMQPGNFLSQLANDVPLPQIQTSDWSTQPSQPSQPVQRPHIIHQKSQSLHIMSSHGLHKSNTAPRGLASPFQPRVSTHHARTYSGRSLHIPSDKSSRPLQSPVELRAPVPLPSLKKRKAMNRFIEKNGTEELMRELFGDAADSSDRGVRDRGFSLGDMSEGARRLSSLFIPPPPVPEPMQTESTEHTQATENADSTMALAPANNDGNSLLVVPSAQDSDAIPRLLSPFDPTGNNHFNTFPRRLAPAMEEEADPFNTKVGGRGSRSLSRAFLQNQR